MFGSLEIYTPPEVNGVWMICFGGSVILSGGVTGCLGLGDYQPPLSRNKALLGYDFSEREVALGRGFPSFP